MGHRWLWAVLVLALSASGLFWRSRTTRKRQAFWRGKHVWITGASSGLGAALAVEVARRGGKVSLAARRSSALDTLVKQIRLAGGDAGASTADVRDSASILAAYSESVRRFGPVDVVVANAGVNHGGLPFVGLSAERIDAVLETNVRGAISTFRVTLPDMLARDRPAHLVGVSSVAAYRGLPGGSVYGASKAALTVFMESLRIELGGTKVVCTTVHPGFVHTPAIDQLDHPKPLAVSAETAASWIANAIADRKSHYGFPWLMEHLLMNAARLAPVPIYDFILSAAAPTKAHDYPKSHR